LEDEVGDGRENFRKRSLTFSNVARSVKKRGKGYGTFIYRGRREGYIGFSLESALGRHWQMLCLQLLQ